MLVLNTDGSFSYTPNPNYHGTDSFTYIVGDGVLDSVPGPVTIFVRSVNDAPVAGDDAAATPGGRPLFLNLLGNDADADADGLKLTTFTTPAHGRLTRSGSGLLYTPTAGYQGTDTFTYTVSDGKGGSDTGSVALHRDGRDRAQGGEPFGRGTARGQPGPRPRYPVSRGPAVGLGQPD